MPETILANRKPFRENAERRGPLPENSRGIRKFPFYFPAGSAILWVSSEDGSLRGVTGLFYPHILL